jgi:hypothetical protein
MFRNVGPMIGGGLILSVISVGFVYAIVRMQARATEVRRIEKEGVFGEAVVARRYAKHDDDNDTSFYLELVIPHGTSWGQDPFAGLGFPTIPAGMHVDRHVSAGFYQSVSEGQQITVRYLPSNPSGCIIPQDVATERTPWFAPYLFIGGLVLFWGVFIRSCVTQGASGPPAVREPRRGRGPRHSTPDG